jgi:low affinity Fe/Cu permease
MAGEGIDHMAQPKRKIRSGISAAAHKVVDMAGSAWAAGASIVLALSWLVVGWTSGFTDHWMSVLVAVTSVFTFVMVFFIQHTTGRQSRALMLKLDELIRATTGARDDLIAAEERPLEEQEHLEGRIQAEARQ